MRKITAISLIILFASTNEVGQILKLPVLVSHYIDHFKEEGQSIYAFFHEHYVHHHGSDNKDQDEDNQLPFKTTTIQQTSVSFLLTTIELNCQQTPLASEKESILPSCFIPKNYLEDVFHPPRIV